MSRVVPAVAAGVLCVVALAGCGRDPGVREPLGTQTATPAPSSSSATAAPSPSQTSGTPAPSSSEPAPESTQPSPSSSETATPEPTSSETATPEPTSTPTPSATPLEQPGPYDFSNIPTNRDDSPTDGFVGSFDPNSGNDPTPAPTR